MGEPWWHTLLEVAGGAAAALTAVSIVVALLVRWRKVHFLGVIERYDRDTEVRLTAAIRDAVAQIKHMIGANGEPLTAVNARNIADLRQQLVEAEARLTRALTSIEREMGQMRVGEQLHRQQGFALAKMQHAAATEAGLPGWPDPEHFRGMLGTPEGDADEQQ